MNVFLLYLFVCSFCHHEHVSWRKRMEEAVDKYTEKKLLFPSDVEHLENLHKLKFSVSNDTVLLVECPFLESWTLDARFIPGCEKCRIVTRCEADCNADIIFRFGYGNCAESAWPKTKHSTQIFSSTSGEARSGSGRLYYESRARRDEDVSVCFDQECDIMFSFSEFVSLSTNSPTPRVSHVAAQWMQPLNLTEKTAAAHALFVNSNCNTLSARTHIVSELRGFGLMIDSAGQCMRNVDILNELPHDRSRYHTKIRAASKYRFLFALENTIESFYITEKLHHAYLSSSVPIVWKRDIVEKQFPPNSFIAVDDYASTRELAEEIIRLNNNDTAYKEYFVWKDEGVPSETVKMWFRSIDLVGCQLCEFHNHQQ